MEDNNISNSNRGNNIRILIIGAISLLIVIRFNDAMGVLLGLIRIINPLIIGYFISYILSIPTDYFEYQLMTNIIYKKSKEKTQNIIKSIARPLSFVISIIIIFAILSVVISLIIPQVVKSVKLISDEFPRFYVSVLSWIDSISYDYSEIEEWVNDIIPDMSIMIKKLTGVMTQWSGSAINAIASFVGSIVNVFLSFIFAIYLVMDKRKLENQARRVLKWMLCDKKRDDLYVIIGVANDTFKSFIVGQVIEAVVLGGLCMIGMIIFRFPYATMIGSLVGLTALIPIVGAFVGCIFGTIMIMMVDPMQGLLFVLFFLVLQQLEGNLIYPKVVGNKIGLPGIWVLAAVTIGGSIFGITGILLGVPILATIYKLIARKTLIEESKKVT